MIVNLWTNRCPVPKWIKRGTPAWGLPYLFLVLLSFLFSCAASRNVIEPGTTHMIEGIPFFQQEIYQCGPASLAGVLNYWGAEASPEVIAGEIYSKSAKGTLSLDMVLYARKKGLHVIQSRGSIKYLKENIDLGYPVIVMVDYGFWVYQQNHFMVIAGYNKNGVIVNSGRNRLKFIREEDFLRSWEKTDFWILSIRLRR